MFYRAIESPFVRFRKFMSVQESLCIFLCVLNVYEYFLEYFREFLVVCFPEYERLFVRLRIFWVCS